MSEGNIEKNMSITSLSVVPSLIDLGPKFTVGPLSLFSGWKDLEVLSGFLVICTICFEFKA